MHFLPPLPFLLFLFPRPLFVAMTVLSLLLTALSPARDSLPDFLSSLPRFFVLLTQAVFLPFALVLPHPFSVLCSYWSLLLTGGFWLVLAIFPLSAWVLSALAASGSSCPILILVCESLALHFLLSFQNWLFFSFLYLCVCVFLTACSQSHHCCIPFFLLNVKCWYDLVGQTRVNGVSSSFPHIGRSSLYKSWKTYY